MWAIIFPRTSHISRIFFDGRTTSRPPAATGDIEYFWKASTEDRKELWFSEYSVEFQFISWRPIQMADELLKICEIIINGSHECASAAKKQRIFVIEGIRIVVLWDLPDLLPRTPPSHVIGWISIPKSNSGYRIYNFICFDLSDLYLWHPIYILFTWG